MTKQELRNLKPGDKVRHIASSMNNSSYWLVTANYGDRVTAVQTMDLTNPPEWELVTA